MKYFSIVDIIRSILFASIYGLICGCLYKASACILAAILKLVALPRDILLLYKCFSLKNAKSITLNQKLNLRSKVGKNIFEFFVFLTFGLGLILLFYVCLDGMLRLYVLVLFLLFFYVSSKTVGLYFELLFSHLFSFVHLILLTISGFLLYPIYKLSLYIAKLFTKCILPIKGFFAKIMHKWQEKRKKYQILPIIRGANSLTKRKRNVKIK